MRDKKKLGKQRRLIIEGSRVTRELLCDDGWQEAGQISTGAFLRSLEESFSNHAEAFFPLPILHSENLMPITDPEAPPLGWVRCYRQEEKTSVYLFEQPPQVHPISICVKKDGKLGGSSLRLLNLAFPWVVFIVKISPGKCVSLHCFFRSEAIAKESNKLYEPALPNINPGINHKACMKIRRFTANKRDDQIIQAVITQFWQSQFNDDYTSHRNMAIKAEPRLANFLQWHELSNKNPHFIKNIKLATVRTHKAGSTPSPLTVDRALKKIL